MSHPRQSADLRPPNDGAAGEEKGGADLTGIDTWIFDLDNTLYPLGTPFVVLIEGRMTAYVQQATGLPQADARALQKKYLHEHGTTLAGLMALHGVDPHDFLREVHDVSMDSLTPDPALREALLRLPGRRLVFTNGSAWHADRVLKRLALDDLFEAVFHLEAADMIPKPAPATYHALIVAHAVAPRSAAFFEDSAHNLEPAARLGMTTILVGPHAAAQTADFVHYRTEGLVPFLETAQVKEIA
jgi:putative hydrolase of the HAD superfamily